MKALEAEKKKDKYSKGILLLIIGLALTLSIGSIRWMNTQKPAPSNKIQALVPVKVQAPAPVPADTIQTKIAEPIKTDSIIVRPEKIIIHEKKDDQEKKIRKNWSKYITAENSSYAYGVLGGINDLSVVFTNETNYPLEEITAKVVYIKANGKPWETKYVSSYNVPPHSKRKHPLAKVNRGKSVQITISKIVSSKMHFNYSSDKASNSDDPYFMK